MRVMASDNQMATAASTRGYSNKNTKRKSIPGAAAPTSPVAMGRALVLLATSCAALSSHPVATTRRGDRRPHHRGRHHFATTSCDRPRRGGNGESRSSALRYRDGDEDQPVDLRTAAGTKAEANAKAGVPSPIRGGPSLRLNILTLAMPSVSIPRMPSSPAPSREEQEQLVMDEYLEYVERRYRSMHPGHHQRRQPRPRKHRSTPRRVALDQRLPRKIFLLWKLSWRRAAPLTAAPTAAASTTRQEATRQEAPAQGPGPEPLDEEEEGEEDPLNILGLSNLASERLRQRRNVPRHWRDEATLLALSREGAAKFVTYCVNTGRPVFVPSGLPPKSSKAASKADPRATPTSNAPAATAEEARAADGGRASAYVALSFPAQLRLLLATARRLAGILAACAGRACGEVLGRGGFRGTVRLAGAAGVAVVLAFRPLFLGSPKRG